ncbi:non-canonical purine NTP diphosphatase [Arenibacter sp. F26102]|uniref:non-canonical purine NTP diphosphatase n=1 Tax=Arenibacter sp. F26102 TaxID=2926416 RepID=UPI001FF60CFC|nr:non-canonical purine NTP diphosphatase [Arenibacter sp. F26102]MCK0147016.1 non-canonical purine NTP diphosphatase [Arenibacter sp. F26102]
MQLVFATHNRNKLKEVQVLFPKEIELLSLEDIGCLDEIPETATTLEGNAIIKANFVTENYGYPCFADDTGLLVDALEGAPGVYSARYAGEQKNAVDNMDKLLSQLLNQSNRSAHFKTVIALNLNNETLLFKGIVDGEITTTKKGERGFGYDPIFKPNGYDQTFAELPLSVKNEISHRAKAIQQLLAFFKNYNHAIK